MGRLLSLLFLSLFTFLHIQTLSNDVSNTTKIFAEFWPHRWRLNGILLLQGVTSSSAGILSQLWSVVVEVTFFLNVSNCFICQRLEGTTLAFDIFKLLPFQTFKSEMVCDSCLIIYLEAGDGCSTTQSVQGHPSPERRGGAQSHQILQMASNQRAWLRCRGTSASWSGLPGNLVWFIKDKWQVLPSGGCIPGSDMGCANCQEDPSDPSLEAKRELVLCPGSGGDHWPLELCKSRWREVVSCFPPCLMGHETCDNVIRNFHV